MENGSKQAKEQPENYCIFERRLCKYARNKNNCFECKAPSDEEMTC